MGSVNAEMNADITNFFKLIKGIKYHRKLCILLNLNLLTYSNNQFKLLNNEKILSQTRYMHTFETYLFCIFFFVLE